MAATVDYDFISDALARMIVPHKIQVATCTMPRDMLHGARRTGERWIIVDACPPLELCIDRQMISLT